MFFKNVCPRCALLSRTRKETNYCVPGNNRSRIVREKKNWKVEEWGCRMKATKWCSSIRIIRYRESVLLCSTRVLHAAPVWDWFDFLMLKLHGETYKCWLETRLII